MGTQPAGVMTGRPAPGWACNLRLGQDAGTDDRVCVDLSPELPEGATRGWACHYQHSPERRICRRDPEAPAVGKACTDETTCVEGTRCTAGRCMPATPAPGCWLDADCGGTGRCFFGSCRA